MPQPKFVAYVPELKEWIDVVALEWNGSGITWVTLLKGIPRRSYHAYGSTTVRRVQIDRIELKQIQGEIDHGHSTR